MAKKFQFRLERVLNLRTQNVSQEKLALGRVQLVRMQKEDESIKQKEYKDKLSSEKSIKARASDLQALQYHKTFVQEEISKLNEEIEQLKEIEELRRVRLTEAMKEEKILVKLKDKKKIDHIDGVKKEEVLTLDEIARNRLNNTNK